MIKAIIIDDEPKVSKRLADIIERYLGDVTIINQATSVKAGVELIKNTKPDLVFLDIEMPEENGFELFSYFADPGFEVIFTTAYNQYAIKAFRYAAIDYLLKPVDIEELKDAVNRVIKKRSQGNNTPIEVLLENLERSDKVFNKLALPSTDGYIVVKVDEIIRLEADGAYSVVYLEQGKKVMVSKHLKEYEKILKDAHFFRLHQSHLVNLNHITKYSRKSNSKVTLSDGSQLEVAHRKREEFRHLLEQLRL